ncbi:Tryptophan or tyrosine transporter protein [Klebsormidium nitens]|uniref:Tryptophan or tyrosine transporter protein n=1 Tax=Klebsormidium nitens TaxID=105231 RepID=A0A1Y1HYF1_KLENI|nr:Tryptophan or tyrosine transporter protein [Klebsormidium nitens]|eukprot:GAQ82209.1 Tryptophan or tyrosine transporter protein [Klebsormidium nitens]
MDAPLTAHKTSWAVRPRAESHVGASDSLVGSADSVVGTSKSYVGSAEFAVGVSDSFLDGAASAPRTGPWEQVQLSELLTSSVTSHASPRPAASLRRESQETASGAPWEPPPEHRVRTGNEHWGGAENAHKMPPRPLPSRRRSSEQDKPGDDAIGGGNGWVADVSGGWADDVSRAGADVGGWPAQRQVAERERASVSGALLLDDDAAGMPLLPRLKIGRRRDSWEEEEKKRSLAWRKLRGVGKRVMGALWWVLKLPGVSDEEGINVLGATLLITGSTISGGALALPAVTQDLGFIPSAVSMTGCWLFQVLEGLLLAEVIVGIMQRLNKDSASITSAASETLGPRTALLLSACYVFYMNATLVANISRGATIVAAMVDLPLDVASLALVLASGALLFVGGVRATDLANRVLTGLLLLSLILTILTGLSHMEVGRLTRGSWAAIPASLPVIMQVLNFLCMLPVVCSILRGEIRLIRVAVILGSGIPLLLYVAWDAVALGLLPAMPLAIPARQTDPVEVLMEARGAHMGVVLTLFAFTAVATTIIGCHLSLSDFFFEYMLPSHVSAAGATKGSPAPPGGSPEAWPGATPAPGRRAKVWACSVLTLLPSLLLAMTVPDMVYSVLDYTSLYLVTILFGVAPPLMCWSLRDARDEKTAAFAVEREFTPRRGLLVVAAAFSVLLLLLKGFEHYVVLLGTFIPGVQMAPKNVPIA